jgi:hypothetical protein
MPLPFFPFVFVFAFAFVFTFASLVIMKISFSAVMSQKDKVEIKAIIYGFCD